MNWETASRERAEYKEVKKIHRKAPAVIDAENRKMDEELPDFISWWNEFSNLSVEYYLAHGIFPKYAYVNTAVWEHVNSAQAREWANNLQIEVRTHKKMPWHTTAMHHEPIPAIEVARYYSGFKRIELLESGRSTIQ